MIGIPLFLLEAMLYKPKLVKKILSLSVGITSRTTDFWLTRKTRRYIKYHIGDIKGKNVMNFGTDVSKFTVELSKLIGDSGKLCVTHASKDHIDATKELAEKHKLNNMIYYVENEARHVIHPKLKDFDAIVSVGVLGYIQDPHKVIATLGKRVKKGGKIYFVDYTNLLKIMPEQKWLHDVEGIKRMFAQAGFKVNVSRHKGLLWNTIHIYGKKV